MGENIPPLDAWNSVQYVVGPLGRAFGELYAAIVMLREINKLDQNTQTFSVLKQVHTLYCLSRVDRDIGTFRNNDFISSEQATWIKASLVDLVGEIKPHAIALTDAFGAPDKTLQSALAQNDGNVYSNFLDKVYKAKNCFGKAPWVEGMFDHSKQKATLDGAVTSSPVMKLTLKIKKT